MNTNYFLHRANELASELTAWRRTLHAQPELGFELPQTTAFVRERLLEMGITPFEVGKSGIGAVIGQGQHTFLLRADMDALPMHEESGEEFASQNENMHACGHDIHTTALLGAAKLLKERESELTGAVKLMFQPCEEGLGGAIGMVEHGILQNPVPEAALALHVVNERLGTAGLRAGHACASCDEFVMTVRGVGCHGAAAYLGVDPLLAAANIVTGLQILNSREVAPDAMLVLTICMIQAGTAANIIPETCTMQGTIRTADPKVRAFATRRAVEIANGIAAAYRCECDFSFKKFGVPPMVNDAQLTSDIARYIDNELATGASWEIPAMTGSEDFAVIGEQVPSVLVWFGTGNKEEGYPHGVHHPKVRFNEAALPQMAAVYASCAVQWLEEHK